MSLGSPIKLHRQAASASLNMSKPTLPSIFSQPYQPVPQSPPTLYGSTLERCLAHTTASSALSRSDGCAPHHLPKNPFSTPPVGTRTSSRPSHLLEHQMTAAQHGCAKHRDSSLRSTLSDKGEKAAQKGIRSSTTRYVRPQPLPAQRYLTPQSGPIRLQPSTAIKGAHRVFILPSLHNQRRGAIISKQLREQQHSGMRSLGSPRRASVSGLTHQLASSLHLRQYVQQQAQMQYPVEDPLLRSPSSESAYSDSGSLFSERSGISCNTTDSVHQQSSQLDGQRKHSFSPEQLAQQSNNDSSYRIFIAPNATGYASVGHPGAAAVSSTRDGQQRAQPYSLPISRFYTRRGAILPHDGTASPTMAARELGIRLQQVQLEREPASGPARNSAGRMSATVPRYGSNLTIPEPSVPLSPLHRSSPQHAGASIAHPRIVLPSLSDRRSSLPLPRLTATASLSRALAPISPVKNAATIDVCMEDCSGEENQEEIDDVESELDFCCRGGTEEMDARTAIDSRGSQCGSGKPVADKMLLQGSARMPSIMVPASELSKRRGKVVRSLNLR